MILIIEIIFCFICLHLFGLIIYQATTKQQQLLYIVLLLSVYIGHLFTFIDFVTYIIPNTSILIHIIIPYY